MNELPTQKQIKGALSVLENVELWVDTGEGKFPAATVLALARIGARVCYPDEETVDRLARAMADDHRLRNREPRMSDEAWAEIRGTSFGLPSWSHYASLARAALSSLLK
jgi:hypothetical protein